MAATEPVLRQQRTFSRLSEIAQLVVRHGFGFLLERPQLRDLVKLPFRATEPPPETRGPRLRALLEDLGPTFVKFGQLLSTRPDVVAPDILDHLQSLQDDVRPLPFEEIRPVVEAELGGTLEELFVSFDPEPLASASIGQVHRARLEGEREVVVKVRRPRAAEQIRADLVLLRQLATLVRQHVRRLDFIDAEGLVAEFGKAISLELDYRVEARSVDEFRRAFDDDDRAQVPEVYWTHTGERVLTLEYFDGPKLRDLSAEELAGGRGRRVAQSMVEVWLDMFLRHGIFHADPHPGNLILLADGRLGLVDFGTVGRLSNDDVRRLTRLFLDAAAGQVDELPRHLAALGVRFSSSVEETLREDLAELFGRYHGRPMTEIDVPLLIRETFEIIHKNGLRLPSRFVLLDKTIATVISVCQSVYPGFNLVEVVRPFARDITVGPWAWRQRAKEVASWSQALLDLPGEVEGSLARLAAGQIEVGFRHENLDVPLRRLDVMNNRLVLGVVISAFFVSSSLVAVLPEDGPQLLGLHALGLAGIVFAVPLAILLGLAILRSGRI